MDEPTPAFRFWFNRRKQWCDVYLDDVTPETFDRRKGGRWGWFRASWENPRLGLFGEIHFVASRIREDVIVHELDHLRAEWMFAKGRKYSRYTEERWALFLDALMRSFLREYRKSYRKLTHKSLILG